MLHYRCAEKLKPGKRGRNQLRKRMRDGVLAEQANKRGYCYHLSRDTSFYPVPSGQQESTLDLTRVH